MSMKISKGNCELAGQFIDENARPLDRALFQYHFRNGAPEVVLAELAHYQNPDGGFGHGLEADFRLVASSPMATSVGLQYAVAVNTPAEHPIIVGAIRYLMSTYNSSEGYWPATYLDVNTEPHAPWWHVDELHTPSDDDWPNPSAELAGYIYRYAQLVPADFLAMINKRVAQSVVQGGGIIAPVKYYNILCWQRALPYFPSDIQEQITSHLRTTVRQWSLEPEDTMEMNICWLTPTPDSIIAQERPDKVNELLDREITRQFADGGWWPTWEWGQYPESWAIARQEWAGKITLEVLLTLQAHDRVASSFELS
jgi:hypothetical protein